MVTMLEKFGFHEIRTAKFIKAVISEFLATAILIISGCGSVVSMDNGKPVSVLAVSFTFAMTVAFIVYTFGHVSGAHINPVVTLGFLVIGHGTLARTIAYTIAQCSGAIAGSAVIWYTVPPSWRGTLGSNMFGQGVTLGQGFVIEVICTFILMLGVTASSDRHRTDHGGSTSLTVGLMVFMQSAWASNISGCSMNPARSLGPAVLSGTWDKHWVYWVAPTLGAVFGALFYHHLLAQSPPPDVADHTLNSIAECSTKQDTEKRKNFTEKSPDVEIISMRDLKGGHINQALSNDTS